MAAAARRGVLGPPGAAVALGAAGPMHYRCECWMKTGEDPESEPAEAPRMSVSRPIGNSRRRSMANLLRMGHCAPTVMQTLRDASEGEGEWLVKLTAGLPGGIGNTGNECGALTAPLILLGLRSARDPACEGLPVLAHRGHDLAQRFERRNGTLLCREIFGHARVPIRCVGVIRRSPDLFAETLSTGGAAAIRGERREAYCRLYDHCAEHGFHCAHAVFHRLGHVLSVEQALLDGTSAFIGGTLFLGMTCSAFAAGVMALGVTLGEIEHSRARVLRMIGVMAAGGDASAEHLNAFNRVMNLGHRLSQWFSAAFGSTQCRALTGCDFSTVAGARRWIEGGGAARCGLIAERVAAQVEGMVAEARGTPRAEIARAGSAAGIAGPGLAAEKEV